MSCEHSLKSSATIDKLFQAQPMIATVTIELSCAKCPAKFDFREVEGGKFLIYKEAEWPIKQ